MRKAPDTRLGAFCYNRGMPRLKNDRHERFCHEYIKDQNATQAYIRAGYSKNGANRLSSRLMSKDVIRARIKELLGEVCAEAKLTRQWILEKWMRLAEYGLVEKEDIPQDCRTAIDALRELGKLEGYYSPDKLKIEGEITTIQRTVVKPK